MKRKVRILLGVLLFLCAIAGYDLYRNNLRCQTEITLTQYILDTNLTQEIRIVHLTDLHSHSFGDDNDTLVNLVLDQNPDLVCITGDMVDRSSKNPEVILDLIRKLSAHIPVYYGYGNHEKSYMAASSTDLTPLLEEAGATVLDCTYQDIIIKDQNLRIGGYHGYYRQPGMYDITPEQREAELSFADRFEDTDTFKLLLCHIPTAWLDWEYIHRYSVDLVLSGHYHGGQIRLPVLGALYAPYIGLFPEYTEGLFTGTQATCVLSRGLGNSPALPRINNLPEVVVIDLIPEK